MLAPDRPAVRGPRWFSAKAPKLSGFALIATLSMLILLLLLAVGLLSLSTISLRTSGQSEASARARANARIALSMALGELQKQAGPDTRVTARADILDDSNPPVLGVWKSWEGTNHTASGTMAGRPISPGNYESQKRNRFLAWLTSVETTTEPPSTARGSKTVALLSEGSVGSGRAELQVHLTPTPVEDSSAAGSIAWWITGENQKARLPVPHEPEQDTPARWSVLRQSHGTADPQPFALDALLKNPELASNAISLLQADLIGGQSSGMRGSQQHYHDLSTSSLGLLTNTATGGWRKDLSLATEHWANIGASNLPFFQVTPGSSLPATKTAARSIFYPWSSYRGNSGHMAIYQHGAVASWENLKDYITAYKRISTNATGRSSMVPTSFAIDGNAASFLHKIRVIPVIARVQWVYSHSAAISGAGGVQPRLLLNPVVTLWNPYNVELPLNTALTLNFAKPLPTALRYTVNGTADMFRSLTAGSLNYSTPMSTSSILQYTIASGQPLKPGETRVFSHRAAALPAGAVLPLTPGFSPTGGHYFDVKNNKGPSIVSADSTVSVEVALDTTYNDIADGVGIYLDMGRGGGTHLAYRMVYPPALAKQVYPPVENLGSISAGELGSTVGNPRPFLTTIFGARMASNTHLSAKGFVQSSPLVNYTAMGGKDRVEVTIARGYGGTGHPINSPFDFSFEPLSAAGSDLLPNVADGNQGYIVTGFTSGTGVSRCVVAEIPLRPMASLAELQHWDLRYENPIPPFAFNLIGNSDATPLLPANAVVNSADASLNVNLQHDDSYSANHLLFDDWFFSSIAPNPTHFGNAGGNLKDTYIEFVTGETPLANRAYRPIAEDAAAATEDSQALFADHVDREKNRSWRTIASRLEVEGMFNVNSTSVTAWRALLGHARNQKVPHITATGSTWQVTASNALDHPVTRMNVSGDSLAAGDEVAGLNAEIGGFQVFTEEMLDQLAENIVEQVRLRGPFLSLAEFVNRQLSSGDLALAGAIQSALNELENDPEGPYKVLRQSSTVSTAQPPRANDAAYKFPQAAVGFGAYGVPGWIRQADVLRPLAPILSARDDTFTIRAYGDARDRADRILSRATCEAVVRRTRDFVDPSDAPDILTPPKSASNQLFGRRFQIVSFRWLHDSEV